MEVSLIRFEGMQVDLNAAGCYVSVDNKLYDVVTPLSSDNPEAAVDLPSSGLLRLIVKNMSTDHEVIGSVSVELASLPESGVCWLPLSTILSEDQVLNFEDECPLPRVLIGINEAVGFQLQQLDLFRSSAYCTPEVTERNSIASVIGSNVQAKLTHLQQMLEENRTKYDCNSEELNRRLDESFRSESEVAADPCQSDRTRPLSDLKLDRDQRVKAPQLHSEAISEDYQKDAEILRLQEALKDLNSRHADLLSLFPSGKAQLPVEELSRRNDELTRVCNLAESERLQLELKLRAVTAEAKREAYETKLLKEQVDHLTEELKSMMPRSSPYEGRTEEVGKVTELEQTVEELQDTIKELRTQYEVVVEELDYAQTSLNEQNVKFELLMQDNAALTQFKTDIERVEDYKEVSLADAEFKEFLRRRGLERLIVRKGEGEYCIENYALKTFRKNGVLSIEATGGLQIVEELIGLALKNENTRSKLSLNVVFPTRRNTGSIGPAERPVMHRRASTELFDQCLSEKSRANELNCFSSKDDLHSTVLKPEKEACRPMMSRKENDQSASNLQAVTRDPTPTKSIFKTTVSSRSKLASPAHNTPVRERNFNRVIRSSDKSAQRIPFR